MELADSHTSWTLHSSCLEISPDIKLFYFQAHVICIYVGRWVSHVSYVARFHISHLQFAYDMSSGGVSENNISWISTTQILSISIAPGLIRRNSWNHMCCAQILCFRFGCLGDTVWWLGRVIRHWGTVQMYFFVKLNFKAGLCWHLTTTLRNWKLVENANAT